PLPADVEVFQFGDNPGHLQETGVDGWGRAFCKGLEIAIGMGFEYVALIDTDFLFMPYVRDVFENMKIAEQKFASCDGPPYQWIEGGLVFANVQWLKDTNYIARYYWQGMRR